MKYTVIYEKSKTGYGAYIPDLEGCIAVGSSLEEVRKLIKEAADMHIEALMEDGLEIPKAFSQSEELELNIA
jgi:predicted RNase H-like HicB family nuclease